MRPRSLVVAQTTKTVEVRQENALTRLLDLLKTSPPTGPFILKNTGQLSTMSRGERVTAGLKVLLDTLRRHQRRPERLGSAFFDELLHQLDARIGCQLDAVLHHPDFQRLEAAWRGLHFLVDRTPADADIRIRVLNVSKADLLASFRAAASLEHSGLYRHVYERAYDTPGSEPYGAVVSNYALTNTRQDVELLEAVSQVAAAAHCPFIAAAGPQFFGEETFQAWTQIPDLARQMGHREYTAWNAFRDTAAARYVGVVLPRFLLRLPYGPQAEPVRAFDYREAGAKKGHETYLWGSASYAFAVALMQAFARDGWCVQIRGPASGGKVDALPVHYEDDGSGEVQQDAVEVSISERLESACAEQGLIPLSVYKGRGYAVFFSAHSAQRPAECYDAEAALNHRINARLPYVFLASRFMHYLKALHNEVLDREQPLDAIEHAFNQWFKQYLNKNPGFVSQEIRAARPLRDAQVTVREAEGKPGYCRVDVRLVPHVLVWEGDVALSMTAHLSCLPPDGAVIRSVPPRHKASPAADPAVLSPVTRFWNGLKKRFFFWKKNRRRHD